MYDLKFVRKEKIDSKIIIRRRIKVNPALKCIVTNLFINGKEFER